ncbi:MAG: DegV family protein [Clostridium sp.]|nr:DegV family protein [Clostridium sp.]
MAVQVLTDSTSYLNEELKKEFGIRVVSLNVTFDDKSFKETEIDNNSFYKMMDEKGIPLSSQPSIEDLCYEMKEVVKTGDDLLCVFLSSEMSGTFNSAHIAKNMILEEYKDAKIEIIDSRSNCMQLGFCSIVAARAAKEGRTLEEVKQIVEDNIKRSRFLFIPDNLVYLKKGGRIGGASAILGNILKIIPILTVENGVTTVFSKVRTKKNAIIKMINKILLDVNEYGLSGIAVHHINCIDEANEVKDKLEKLLNIKVKIFDIGPVIGLHVGPGAIGIAYYTKKDMR